MWSISERHLAILREGLSTRTPTEGDAFTMKIRGETFTDRTKAGRQIIFTGAALKPLRATKQIGEFGGSPISIQKLDVSASIHIHGKST